MSNRFESAPEKSVEIVAAPAQSFSSPEFSIEQRRFLLRSAHEAILSELERHPLPLVQVAAELRERRGVFTTLYLRNSNLELRGCVGYAEPIAPLYRAVAETACAAAFEDTRFSPVTKDEAQRLEVSLSVLSSLFPIHPDAVEVGRHGLVVSRGARRGLLLPQVPVERGWGPEMFLEQTCVKAGLPAQVWRKDASVSILAFVAEVFSDADFR